MRWWVLALVPLSIACRSSSAPRSQESARRAQDALVRRLLCADIGEEACLARCSEALSPDAAKECLLAFRFGADEKALELARGLARRGDTLLGVDTDGWIEGFRGQRVDLYPALPLGDQAHHLGWIRGSLEAFDRFLDTLKARAPASVTFDPNPRGFVFFRTEGGSYPSAYCMDEMIAYNLDGPLHADRRVMHETLFHELFHLNDERAGFWSDDALGEIFDAIVERCDDDHACYSPYAPHDSVVDDGTFYAFDERTRHVREYAAELALRYFLEHEAVLSGRPWSSGPFKCGSQENAIAWERVSGRFFGGVDLTPGCAVSGHHARERL